MNHPAEMALHRYMTDAANGKSYMSKETIKQVSQDVSAALQRQFGSGSSRQGPFRLRMSNIGRPTCQLWFAKHKPETALPKPTHFVMNMMLGDIVEAVFKGILKEAGVAYSDDDNFVTLDIGGHTIKGSYDLEMDGAIDDVKSASAWSYDNKFRSFGDLHKGDSFGYVAQLVGYAKAAGKKVGGWWVVNKANGHMKYVDTTGIDVGAEVSKIEATIKKVDSNEFERCFEPVEETFRSKPTGNTILNSNCRFCDYRFECWPNLREEPSRMSKAKVPPTVQYLVEAA